ncbi:MAG: peptide-methionine (R)-S-oxide reductase MsrB [Phycisphaeraceae bacterium]|nr:peptide-methionine (R)-S-oxide reductase MsrB [Phycisphaeraceae bacterium]
MKPSRLTALLLPMILLIVGCANESTPYNEQTAQIDPAMNQPEPQPPSPSGLEADEINDKVTLSDEQWRAILSDEEFRILRRSGTELGGTGRYLDHGKDDKGAYHCVGCGNYLYDAKHKFHSGCGWPSFFQEVDPGAIVTYEDKSIYPYRTEMRCARCDGHLGHVFPDGFGTPTGLRHCVNGTALIFVPEGEDEEDVIKAHREKYADK